MSDSNVYTAERILAKRVYKGVTQYHIKWQGYSAEESTWEPVENIIDRGLLTTFEKNEGKKNKRSSSSSASKRKISKNFDNRENSIDNSAATTSKNIITNNSNSNSTAATASLRLDQANNITSSPIANSNNITRSPTVKTSTSASTSPSISRTPQQISINVSPKISTLPTPSPPQPTPTPPQLHSQSQSETKTTTEMSMAIMPVATNQTFSPNSYRSIVHSSPSPSPSATVSIPVMTPHSTPTKITEVYSEPEAMESIEEITVQRINSNSSPSPTRLSSTPINNFIILPQDNNNSNINSTNNTSNNINNISNNNNSNNNNSSQKNRRVASRFAILNTVITDVTVNDQTITISESKTNQGFFKEVSRHSVSVECATTHSNNNDSVDMVD